ncbi:GYD domain-containing protein [Natrinema soli]|uniref:GYD domain-containing protein n=1 Tax=Natrinema soli TaxID=1930624 RepID=A0ABD5SPW1_9EURY|nr:GYD domain-containing protein [Natrinema soli]
MTTQADETPTYVFLTNFTQQGIGDVTESPGRTEEAKALVESMGGTWKGFFVTMGRYDGLVIAELPDDATAAQAALTLASGGNVTTETLRAFPLDEFRDIVDATE